MSPWVHHTAVLSVGKQMKSNTVGKPLKLILKVCAGVTVMLIVAAITGTWTWAYGMQERVTKLEQAFISMTSDMHDIKVYLMSKPR